MKVQFLVDWERTDGRRATFKFAVYPYRRTDYFSVEVPALDQIILWNSNGQITPESVARRLFPVALSKVFHEYERVEARNIGFAGVRLGVEDTKRYFNFISPLPPDVTFWIYLAIVSQGLFADETPATFRYVANEFSITTDDVRAVVDHSERLRVTALGDSLQVPRSGEAIRFEALGSTIELTNGIDPRRRIVGHFNQSPIPDDTEGGEGQGGVNNTGPGRVPEGTDE